jgi:hypothetical protein
MPKTIELLPKTFNYTIGINNNKNNLEKDINDNENNLEKDINDNEKNEILIENKEIKGNISN